MDRQKAQELYAQAAAKEREDYLYKRALTKVKPVTRDMSEAEKEKYLQSKYAVSVKAPGQDLPDASARRALLGL